MDMLASHPPNSTPFNLAGSYGHASLTST